MKLIVYKNGTLIEEREITKPIFFDCDDSYLAVYPSGKQWVVYDEDDDFCISCIDLGDDGIIETNSDIEQEIADEVFMQHYDNAMKLLLGIKQ